VADSTDDPAIERGDEVEVANEFAQVRLCKVLTRNGERLEIRSPKLGRGIRLDPLELESLTWQTTETFAGFLEEPFGPEHR
jgi:hypothetical protein